MIHLKGTARGSKSATDTLCTVVSAESYGSSIRAVCTIAWNCFRALFSSGPHSKLASILGDEQEMSKNNTTKQGVCCLQNPRRSPLGHIIAFQSLRQYLS